MTVGSGGCNGGGKPTKNSTITSITQGSIPISLSLQIGAVVYTGTDNYTRNDGAGTIATDINNKLIAYMGEYGTSSPSTKSFTKWAPTNLGQILFNTPPVFEVGDSIIIHARSRYSFSSYVTPLGGMLDITITSVVGNTANFTINSISEDCWVIDIYSHTIGSYVIISAKSFIQY